MPRGVVEAVRRWFPIPLIVLLVAGCTNSGTQTVPLEVDLGATGISHTAPFEVSFSAATNRPATALSYTWDYGDKTEAVEGASSSARTYLHPGQYTVNVTVNDGKASVSDSIVINVLEPQYYGDWRWIAMYPDTSFYRGVLSITLAAEDADGFTDTSVGVWSLEYSDGSGWDEPFGYGLIGTYTESGDSGLATVLLDEYLNGMLVGVDFDNRIGAEFDGDPSFYGAGVWINYDGSQDYVDVGMRKEGKDPLFAPAPNFEPIHPSTSSLVSQALPSSSITTLVERERKDDRRAQLEILLRGDGTNE